MPPIPLKTPAGLEILPTLNGLTIRRVWRGPQVWFMALFVIIWDGALFFWYDGLFSRPSKGSIETLFPLVHAAAGLFATYSVIAAFFNRTDIAISSSRLRITHQPVPWPSPPDLSRADITAIVMQEKAKKGYSSTYRVLAIGPNQSEKKLLELTDYKQASFIAHTLRQTLGVPGEDT